MHFNRSIYVYNLPFPELGNDHDGSKTFLFSDEHVICDICEHCGLQE